MSARNETRYYPLYQRFLAHLRTPLFRNGYALTLSSLATSGIGLVYWILAAHEYPANVIGINSAVISAMMFLAGVSELNLMSALIRFIPMAGSSTKRFIVCSYLVSLVISATISFVFIQKLPAWSPALQFLGVDRTLTIWFILSTMIWCIFVLQDSVLTGLRQATWVPLENIVYSLAKIVLMVVFASSIPALGIFASWSLALIVAVLPTNYLIFRRLVPDHIKANDPKNGQIEARQVIRFAAADYMGALFWLICTTLLPVIVTTVVGGTANAYFYLTWTIANSLYLIGPSMGSSLVVEAAKDQKKLVTYSYRVFQNTAKIVIPTAVFLIICAPFILTVFGKGYSLQGTTLLRLLALSAIPNTINAIFVSVARVQRRMGAVVATLGSLCFLILTLGYTFMKFYGIVGVGIGWVVSQSVVAGIVFLTQLRGLWANKSKDETGLKLVSLRGDGNGALICVLYRMAKGSGFFPMLKILQKEWTSRQIRERISCLLPEIVKELPVEIYNPSRDHWKIHQVAITVTNKTVAFLGPSGESPPIVLKLPGSNQDADSLKKQYEVLISLNHEERLGEWRRLLPVLVAIGENNGQVYVAERTIPGITVRRFSHDSGSRQRAIQLAATEISTFHRKTASCVFVDEEMIKCWVHEPLSNIRRLGHNGSIRDPELNKIDYLASKLPTALLGRPVCVSWVHGDYSPSNILVDPEGTNITGIVDWDLARQNDLPLLDLMHLLISTRMDLYQHEMGHVVRHLLLKGDWTPDELRLMQTAQGDLPGSPIDLQVMLLLCWLRHVNANLNKTSRFTFHKLWATENIVTVLQVLDNPVADVEMNAII